MLLAQCHWAHIGLRSLEHWISNHLFYAVAEAYVGLRRRLSSEEFAANETVSLDAVGAAATLVSSQQIRSNTSLVFEGEQANDSAPLGADDAAFMLSGSGRYAAAVFMQPVSGCAVCATDTACQRAWAESTLCCTAGGKQQLQLDIRASSLNGSRFCSNRCARICTGMGCCSRTFSSSTRCNFADQCCIPCPQSQMCLAVCS